jgi:hypothetical protein
MDIDKKCYGWVGRDFSGKQDLKYLNSPGIKLMWVSDHCARTAVILEGIVDALHVERAMLARSSTAALATLGCALTDTQFEQLHRFEKLILFPDFDRPGIVGLISMAKKCIARNLHPLVVVPPELDGRDAGEMGEEEIVGHVSTAEPWAGNIEHRLQAIMAKEGML